MSDFLKKEIFKFPVYFSSAEILLFGLFNNTYVKYQCKTKKFEVLNYAEIIAASNALSTDANAIESSRLSLDEEFQRLESFGILAENDKEAILVDNRNSQEYKGLSPGYYVSVKVVYQNERPMHLFVPMGISPLIKEATSGYILFTNAAGYKNTSTAFSMAIDHDITCFVEMFKNSQVAMSAHYTRAIIKNLMKKDYTGRKKLLDDIYVIGGSLFSKERGITLTELEKILRDAKDAENYQVSVYLCTLISSPYTINSLLEKAPSIDIVRLFEKCMDEDRSEKCKKFIFKTLRIAENEFYLPKMEKLMSNIFLLKRFITINVDDPQDTPDFDVFKYYQALVTNKYSSSFSNSKQKFDEVSLIQISPGDPVKSGDPTVIYYDSNGKVFNNTIIHYGKSYVKNGEFFDNYSTFIEGDPEFLQTIQGKTVTKEYISKVFNTVMYFLSYQEINNLNLFDISAMKKQEKKLYEEKEADLKTLNLSRKNPGSGVEKFKLAYEESEKRLKEYREEISPLMNFIDDEIVRLIRKYFPLRKSKRDIEELKGDFVDLTIKRTEDFYGLYGTYSDILENERSRYKDELKELLATCVTYDYISSGENNLIKALGLVRPPSNTEEIHKFKKLTQEKWVIDLFRTLTVKLVNLRTPSETEANIILNSLNGKKVFELLINVNEIIAQIAISERKSLEKRLEREQKEDEKTRNIEEKREKDARDKIAELISTYPAKLDTNISRAVGRLSDVFNGHIPKGQNLTFITGNFSSKNIRTKSEEEILKLLNEVTDKISKNKTRPTKESRDIFNEYFKQYTQDELEDVLVSFDVSHFYSYSYLEEYYNFENYGAILQTESSDLNHFYTYSYFEDGDFESYDAIRAIPRRLEDIFEDVNKNFKGINIPVYNIFFDENYEENLYNHVYNELQNLDREGIDVSQFNDVSLDSVELFTTGSEMYNKYLIDRKDASMIALFEFEKRFEEFVEDKYDGFRTDKIKSRINSIDSILENFDENFYKHFSPNSILQMLSSKVLPINKYQNFSVNKEEFFNMSEMEKDGYAAFVLHLIKEVNDRIGDIEHSMNKDPDNAKIFSAMKNKTLLLKTAEYIKKIIFGKLFADDLEGDLRADFKKLYEQEAWNYFTSRSVSKEKIQSVLLAVGKTIDISSYFSDMDNAKKERTPLLDKIYKQLDFKYDEVDVDNFSDFLDYIKENYLRDINFEFSNVTDFENFYGRFISPLENYDYDECLMFNLPQVDGDVISVEYITKIIKKLSKSIGAKTPVAVKEDGVFKKNIIELNVFYASGDKIFFPFIDENFRTMARKSEKVENIENINDKIPRQRNRPRFINNAVNETTDVSGDETTESLLQKLTEAIGKNFSYKTVLYEIDDNVNPTYEEIKRTDFFSNDKVRFEDIEKLLLDLGKTQEILSKNKTSKTKLEDETKENLSKGKAAKLERENLLKNKTVKLENETKIFLFMIQDYILNKSDDHSLNHTMQIFNKIENLTAMLKMTFYSKNPQTKLLIEEQKNFCLKYMRIALKNFLSLKRGTKM